ncbi:MAG: transglycosylase domain-containing protein [Bacteroidia bacterium]
MLKITPRFKKILTLAIKIAGVFLLLLLIGYFSFRNVFLQKAIAKVQSKLMDKYQVELKINEAGFEGLSGLKLQGLSLVPLGKDTILQVNEFALSVKFWYALIGDIRVKHLSLNGGYLQLIKKGDSRNFETFLNNRDTTETKEEVKEESSEKNYAKTIYQLISKVLNKVPNEVEMKNFSVHGVDDERFVSFALNEFKLFDQHLNASMKVNSNSINQTWVLSGFANPSAKTADITFSSSDTSRVMIPYLFERFNVQAGFENIRLQLNQVDLDGGELKVNGNASVKNFSVNHPKIAKEDVIIKNAEFDYSYLIGSNFISLDSSSTVKLNEFVIHPFIKFENGPDTVFYFIVKTETTTAQNFINALPVGLFNHIKGMEANGAFSYRLDFIYNENHPDQMVFESTLNKDNFQITKFGEANLSKLNSEFTHYPYENGRATRPIVVGPSNPDFTPLDQISPFLKKCVLTTEDPSFFYHRGFVTEAFRQSIVKNIRTGKFKRGASTISMQLIKNVFLTREKTMARKLEEILLVYILENNYLVSKERMFEVYLNIIEWGPNVYGIGEASRFYFRKQPSQLTLSECLYLATIIPRPKGFMWRFNKDGSAKDYLEKTYRFLANKMLNRELILPDDTLGLTHQVQITGPAKLQIIKNDSMSNDSILQLELNTIANPEQPADINLGDDEE